VGADIAILDAVGGTVMRGKAEPPSVRDSIQTSNKGRTRWQS
jgi:hypothetical protein